MPSTKLTPRGFRGPGLGRASYIEAPTEYRGTTNQVCGLWPFAAGAGSPMVGTPIGKHLVLGTSVCFDEMAWFRRAKLINQASSFTLGHQALGKSTLTRRRIFGLTAQGVTPLILGDTKPDYADQVRMLGGQVPQYGPGVGGLNPLDVGGLARIIPRLSGREADRVATQVQTRREAVMKTLSMLSRRSWLADYEETVLATALRILGDRHRGGASPQIGDLVQVIADGHDDLDRITLARGDPQRYRELVDPLHRTLIGLVEGSMGALFARATTEPLDFAAPAVCMDVSAIPDTDEKLQAAALFACWSDGFGAVEAAHTLADAGLEPPRLFVTVHDELWKVIRAASGMADRIDAHQRLNRTDGLGNAYMTHSLRDLDAAPSPEDKTMARGLINRAAVVIMGGLSKNEVDDLAGVINLSDTERAMVTDWSAPASWDAEHQQENPPPGRGKFLIKVGNKPGIPVEVVLTDFELRTQVHNTNQRFDTRAAADPEVGG